MPYIVQSKRPQLDEVAEDLLRVLRDLELDDPDKDNMEGNLNYFFSKILNELYTNNYADINNAVGLLNCIALEYYLRFAAPYERQKAFENGDVYER